MSPTPDDRAGQGDDHPVEDLASLLGGDLALVDLRRTVRHTRSCPSCQSELVELAAGSAALRLAGHHGVGLPAELPAPTFMDVVRPTAPALPPPLPGHRRRRRAAGRMTAVLAAAVVAAAVIVVALRKPHPSPTDVALAPIDRSGAHGQVEMRGDGADRTMVVTTGLAPATPGTYYEVWLLREATGAMVPLGVLPSTGRARYTIPSRLVADFDAVDISLQPEDGSTVHSPTSVLRAYYG